MPLIEPETFRFIKLGAKGTWEKSCIEEESTIRLGYESPYHENSLAGDWTPVRAFWLECRKGDRGAASRDLKQIRDFYELSEHALWFTFYKRRLYWCFAERQIVQRTDDGSRTRRTRNGWSYRDINGNELTIENVDGRVSKVQGFRGTICAVEPWIENYLKNKINGVERPDVRKTKEQIDSLQLSIQSLIQGLWWKDFELLVDLIFAQSGWQRLSVLGQTDKDIDLDVFSPVTNRRAFIQVKSEASDEVFDNCVTRFREMDQFDEMYSVVHTCDPKLTNRTENRVNVLDLEKLSKLVINAGLINWLITKRS